MLSPEQEKQVEEIRERHKAFFCGDEETGFNQFTRSMDAMSDLLAIVDDLRKQLNAAVLLGQAAASLNKPMTDAEFRKQLNEKAAEIENLKGAGLVKGGNVRQLIRNLRKGKVGAIKE